METKSATKTRGPNSVNAKRPRCSFSALDALAASSINSIHTVNEHRRRFDRENMPLFAHSRSYFSIQIALLSIYLEQE